VPLLSLLCLLSLSARFLCRWGLLFPVRSLLFSVGLWGSVCGARSVYRLGFWLLFDPIYTSLHTSLIDRHLPSFRELVCEESSLDRSSILLIRPQSHSRSLTHSLTNSPARNHYNLEMPLLNNNSVQAQSQKSHCTRTDRTGINQHASTSYQPLKHSVHRPQFPMNS
jgi:hypothetical protein